MLDSFGFDKIDAVSLWVLLCQSRGSLGEQNPHSPRGKEYGAGKMDPAEGGLNISASEIFVVVHARDESVREEVTRQNQGVGE